MQMKLYTEEQVIDIVKRAFNREEWDGDTVGSLICELTTIELPSDEKIEEESVEIMEEWFGSDCLLAIESHIKGAKWVIEQIKKQAE